MQETRIITFSASNTEVQDALAFARRFLAESTHCRHFAITPDPVNPAQALQLSWEWDSARWQAIAWQQIIGMLTEADLEFTVSLPIEPGELVAAR